MQQPFEPYRFADLSGSDDAVQQIRELERQLTRQRGVPVTLIAFQPETSEEDR
ncbi:MULTISPECIES: hypothetical protein [unclassified Paenibacillus]|uniref:hypothetical protein n=1 Tax=unclassified Paenibacillus TaxID=185978 RepID=UPI0009564AC0|nr:MULTISPECIES: hypothetical protein [unclassified Paenibacillus]QID16052.1 hypothetical protein CIC07_25310 [Paenibacillus sp. RUD330]SIR14793.1 hypothetical protein SAMN05880555_3133 [Paenibacillus sp. RU4X]SIR23199.1 hypothetical protein SAMN05880570_2864 [Paenibacillus sp. RU4T]